MEHLRAKQNLLLFSLQKKKEKLSEIKDCTLLQGAQPSGEMPLSSELYQKKQELIEEIKKLDNGFESVSAEVIPFLKADTAGYSQYIKRLQEYIFQIEQLQQEISRLEQENFSKLALKTATKSVKPAQSLPKQVVSGKYQQQKKKQ